ncbi:MAG: hypothetical protein OHK0039_08660 [Bacteroidia bacterium]
MTFLAAMALVLSSCVGALDRVPFVEQTSATVYQDLSNYKPILAKLYAGLALSGQQGPAGKPDISGIDEGFSTYLRQYWKAQELPTDEAVIGWNDGSLPDYHDMDWTSSNEFITAMYNRIYYQISLCNEYIRETSDDKLSERGFDAAAVAEIKTYRAEARFLRALSYYHALDLFGNVPFVTEEDGIGSFLPGQTNRKDLFTYIESELKAIDADLVDARQNEYGRADRAAAWTLLAKLYLNAEVYIGENRYTEAADNCRKVIDAGFSLDDEYRKLFLTDNDQSNEIIFPVTFDGNRTKTWGGMTFLVHAPVGGSMNPAEFGINGGWAGLRTTRNLVDLFPAGGGGAFLVEPAEGATYPVLYVPGSYQGWDPANATTVLASAASDGKYEGYFWFDANTEFKFTDGPAWDVNYGDDGADGTLEPGGANLLVSEAGFYKVNVDLDALTYTMQATNWGLIGSATANGWDSDQDMTYDTTDNAWVIEAVLVAGEIKFRANDDWGLNYGDTGADALLEEGGANIAIPADGTYIIKLYLDKPDYTYSIALPPGSDSRRMFYTNGQNLEINDIFTFTDGYAITKYRNVSSTGAVGSDSEGNFPDTDFPMFRLADVYLMYAEAALRGGGDVATGLGYVNALRQRAYGDSNGDVSSIDLDFILEERARELYWEAHRRTDLIRFGKFTGDSYLWPWKGGVKDGRSVPDYLELFPIPSSDMVANPNLTQNTGY